MTTPAIDPDYARGLVQSPAALAAEIKRLAAQAGDGAQPEPTGNSLPGVSVIMPTYRGADRISRALASLEAQDLPPEEFEVIVVANGPDDGTQSLLGDFMATTPLNLRVLVSPVASAGAARNLALRAARFEYVTFVDDDDRVGASFLSSMLDAAPSADIVLAPIVNVLPDGTRDEDNALNSRIVKLRGQVVPLRDVFWALGFNACKLVPTALARRDRYQVDLRSGEDLVYFAHLLQTENLTLTAALRRPDSSYERALRDDSVSRRQEGVEFSVVERLACMRALTRLRARVPAANAGAIDRLIDAQRGFISRFAAAQPDAREQILGTVAAPDYQLVPWPAINKGKARDLAIAYCFMPYSDTSGVVAAKAIVERRRIVDVISNDMGKVRRIDQTLTALSGPWVDEHVVVPTPASFAGWEPISSFATKALAAAERLDALKGPYETLYSRALWMGSHVAAALFKLRHWQVEWSAEFSDPLRRGADGSPRVGALVDNKVSRRLHDSLVVRGFGDLPIETSFDLVEAATLILADSVMFTNDSQMSYMLSLYSDRKLRSLVEAKAVVRPHPTPDAALYDASPTLYEVAPHLVNIAYFGSFYPNRGIGDVLRAISALPEAIRRVCRIHIFCNDPAGVKQQVADIGVSSNVYVNPYLSYLEFLNATKLFDVLLVNDVTRDEMLPVNPFLPSKYSDYLGSGRSIWALVDPGSPLDRATDLTYRTSLDKPENLAGRVADIIRAELARKGPSITTVS